MLAQKTLSKINTRRELDEHFCKIRRIVCVHIYVNFSTDTHAVEAKENIRGFSNFDLFVILIVIQIHFSKIYCQSNMLQ